jgi:hypothetical protein
VNPTCSPWKFAVGNGTGYTFDSNLPQEWRNAFSDAAAEWNNMHSSYGRSDMYLNPGATGLTVLIQTPSDPDSIAEWDSNDNVIRINPAYASSLLPHK